MHRSDQRAQRNGHQRSTLCILRMRLATEADVRRTRFTSQIDVNRTFRFPIVDVACECGLSSTGVGRSQAVRG
jgi:hypothetical protein